MAAGGNRPSSTPNVVKSQVDSISTAPAATSPPVSYQSEISLASPGGGSSPIGSLAGKPWELRATQYREPYAARNDRDVYPISKRRRRARIQPISKSGNKKEEDSPVAGLERYTASSRRPERLSEGDLTEKSQAPPTPAAAQCQGVRQAGTPAG